MIKQTKLNTFLHEPLLHFLLIGAGLFFLFSQISDPQAKTDHRITITQAKLDILANTWLKRMGRPPSAQERDQQLEHYIREQILYREAMNMGLDKDDAIVRRRLANKMEYLFNDLSFIPEPTDTELASFLSDHTAKFILPATITFSQIYLDPGSHNQEINKVAKQLLEQLKQTTARVDTMNIGDKTQLPYKFTKARQSEISSMFGTAFTNQAFALPVNSWQGPVTSEYGLHLIYINTHTKAQLPQLAEIRQRVASEWRTTKQHEANETFYQSLHRRYEIILDDNVANDAMTSVKQ